MAGDPTRTAKGSELAHAYAMRLLQHLVVPTFVIDAQRRVVVWNRACERLTGVAAAQSLRPRFSSLRRSAFSLMKPAASRWS